MPTQSGVVKRISLTPLGILVLVGFFSLSGYLAVNAVREYRDLQVQRLYHLSIEEAFAAHKASAERELKVAKRQLSAVAVDRDSLKEQSKRMQHKMQELDSIVSSVKAFMGTPLTGKSAVRASSSTGGVGGAEIPVVFGGAGLMAMYSPSRAARAGRQGAQGADFDNMVGELRFLPIAAPVRGNVTSRFGPRRSPFHRGISRHQGLDISARVGEPVYAPADGVVARVVRHPTYGLMIDVNHSQQLSTRYAHLSRASVVEGQTIKRGSRLGSVGTSGRSTGPHLHYEVRHRSQAIDPERFLNVGHKLVQLSSRE